MNFYILIIAFLLSAGCKVTEHSVSGVYKYDQQDKVRLQLNPDKTFKFIMINKNPYLFINDHADERFYLSSGVWEISKRNIYLTSYTDSVDFIVDVKVDSLKNRKRSTFQFFDIYNDSVGAGKVNLFNEGVIIPGKRIGLYSFDADLAVVDSLEFTFYGYPKWKFVKTSQVNQDFIIRFHPPIEANVFKKKLFKARKEKLIEIIEGERYQFIKIRSSLLSLHR